MSLCVLGEKSNNLFALWPVRCKGVQGGRGAGKQVSWGAEAAGQEVWGFLEVALRLSPPVGWAGLEP